MIALLLPPSPPTSLTSPSLSCSLSLTAPAKHSTLSRSLAPGSLLSILLWRSVAVWKERRVVTGKAGGRSQSWGKSTLSFPSSILSPFPLICREWHTDLTAVSLSVIWNVAPQTAGSGFPSLFQSFLLWYTVHLCLFLQTSFVFASLKRFHSKISNLSLYALHVPLFCSLSPCVSAFACLSLSEVCHTALYIACHSVLAYQISSHVVLSCFALIFWFSHFSVKFSKSEIKH